MGSKSADNAFSGLIYFRERFFFGGSSMKRQIARVLMASLVGSGPPLVLAQLTEPPPIVKIVREDLKPGKGAAHEKTENAFARAFSKTAFPNHVAWEAISGQTQVWFIEGYDSYAGIEAASKIAGTEPLKSTLDQLEVQDSELRTGERTIIAHYVKSLSYAPTPFNLAKAHFVWVDVVQVRTGYAQEFAESHQIEHAAFEKAGEKMTEIVYRVSEGALSTTYLVAWPMESLRALDEDAKVRWNTREAMGERYERHRQLNKDIFVSREHILFAVNPKMSNPPKAYVEAEPDFWVPKPK
jgi:hypothetical protein